MPEPLMHRGLYLSLLLIVYATPFFLRKGPVLPERVIRPPDLIDHMKSAKAVIELRLDAVYPHHPAYVLLVAQATARSLCLVHLLLLINAVLSWSAIDE